MGDDLRDLILAAQEASLDAQLRAVRRLRKVGSVSAASRRRVSRSQVDMAFDVLVEAGAPLHIMELLARVRRRFGASVDRESLVSSLSKKVARGDRFVRTAKNTFGVIPTTR